MKKNDFAEPATTWKGASRRSFAAAGPLMCGSYLIGKIFDRPVRMWVVFGLALIVGPLALGAIHRSWRVGAILFATSAVVVAVAWAFVGLIWMTAV